jgi:hypothetical protein
MFKQSGISIELERLLGEYFSLLLKFPVISYWQNVIQVYYSSTWLIYIYRDQYYLFRLKRLFLGCIENVDNSSKLLWTSATTYHLTWHPTPGGLNLMLHCVWKSRQWMESSNFHNSLSQVSNPAVFLVLTLCLFFVIHFNISFPFISTKVWLLYND